MGRARSGVKMAASDVVGGSGVGRRGGGGGGGFNDLVSAACAFPLRPPCVPPASRPSGTLITCPQGVMTRTPRGGVNEGRQGARGVRGQVMGGGGGGALCNSNGIPTGKDVFFQRIF